jgi:hypothetical protein
MWFNVDDKLDGSPEYRSIPKRWRDKAIHVWLRCGVYVSNHLTDGYVSDDVFEEFGGGPAIRTMLTNAGFFNEVSGGLMLTELHCRFPTAAGVQRERKASTARVQRHRQREHEVSTTAAGGKRNGADLGQHVDVAPLRKEVVAGDVTPSPGYGLGTGKGNSLVSTAVVTLAGDVTSDDSFELATAERGRSPAVNVGASRLVATVVGTKVNNADKTVLRLKASEMLGTGESEDDVAECLRLWLTKSELGAHGLPLCMAEVYKRRNNGSSAVDDKVRGWLALGKETR